MARNDKSKFLKRSATKEGRPTLWRITACFAVAILCFGFAGWFLSLYVRWTPIYSPIVCKFGLPTLKGLKMGVLLSPTTEVLLEVETKCRNPNIYSIEFGESPSDDVYVVVEDVFGNAGRVVAGQRVNSGSSMSLLPAHGNGSIVSDAKVLISSSLVTKLLPGMMKGKGVVVNLELRDEMKVEIPFLFGHVNIKKSMNKKCGMRLAGLSDALQAKEPIGPLACANTWESLRVPSLKDLGDQEMVLTKERLGEGEIDTLELAKDIGLGGGSILLFFLGIIFTILTLRQLCCGRTGGSGADSDGEYSDCLE